MCGQDRLEGDPQARRAAESSCRGPPTRGDLGDLRVAGWHVESSDGVGKGEQRGRVDRERSGIVERDTIVDEVPVGPEVLGDPPYAGAHPEPVELAEFDERTTAVDQPAGRLGIVEQMVEQVVPLLLEGEAALEFVEHREAGRQPGLDREVEQQPAGERVQRADRVRGRAGRGQRSPAGVDCDAEVGADPGAELGGRLLGERDRGDGGDVDAALDQVDDAVDERAGLAGTGSGLDEQGRVEVVADALACRTRRAVDALM